MPQNSFLDLSTSLFEPRGRFWGSRLTWCAQISSRPCSLQEGSELTELSAKFLNLECYHADKGGMS